MRSYCFPRLRYPVEYGFQLAQLTEEMVGQDSPLCSASPGLAPFLKHLQWQFLTLIPKGPGFLILVAEECHRQPHTLEPQLNRVQAFLSRSLSQKSSCPLGPSRVESPNVKQSWGEGVENGNQLEPT